MFMNFCDRDICIYLTQAKKKKKLQIHGNLNTLKDLTVHPLFIIVQELTTRM